jgi:uncharacterized membrane protein
MSINSHDQERYTETEHSQAYTEPVSSAGLPTQQLSLPSSEVGTSLSTAEHNNNYIALALIGVGVLSLLGQFWPGRAEMTGGLVLLTIASCFLFFAFWKRIYGLMIPGCILGGLSVGVPFAGVTGGVSVLWGLALGFIAIALLGRVFFGIHRQWPIYPAVPLFAVGLIVAISTLPAFFINILAWLPILLIGLGLYLGWGRQHAV